MGVNLLDVKRIYFVGIKGVALSALALICQDRGMSVAGSDVPDEFITDKVLRQRGIEAFPGFNAQRLLDWKPDLAVLGMSWNDQNLEVAAVKQRGLPFLMDSELRGLLMAEKPVGIAVAGVHGKTTTTSLLTYVFEKAGLSPSYLIGTASIPDLGVNGRWANGRHFIVEADEYRKSHADRQPKFLDLLPQVAIITSVEWEHLDAFPTPESVEQAFAQLAARLPADGLLAACIDYPAAQRLINKTRCSVATYGLHPSAIWRPEHIEHRPDGMRYQLTREGVDLGEFQLRLAGVHNVLNAIAVTIVALREGVPLGKIREALAEFRGTERRFQVTELDGVTWVDDYGHHPTEVRVTLEAARLRFAGRRLWCVFQPHQVSRTLHLKDQFATAFNAVDQLLLLPIFASAREQADGITSADLAELIRPHQPNVLALDSFGAVRGHLAERVKPGDVVVTMGAGDVYKVMVRDELKIKN